MTKRLALTILIALLIGCTGQPQTTQSTTAQTATTLQTTTAPSTAPTTTRDPNIPLAGEVFSPINGKVIAEAAAERRPLAVMIDNFHAARPQAGLNEADIVYEIYVEGLITRYMALFQSELPKLIGPIRSARPYYLRLAMEYDAYYAHVGGSMQAMADLQAFKIADIDGLASGRDTFWRKDHKVIPNNMYGSSQSLIDWANRLNYRTAANFDSWLFGADYGADNAEKLIDMTIVYRHAKSADDVFRYKIGFHYDEESQTYLRTVNEEPQLDEVTKAQIYADSIIVQRAATYVIDDYGRLSVELVGSGTGYYLYDGKVIPITWQKQSERARTSFYTENGEELVLKRGKIWVQVVKLDYQIETVGEEE